MARQGLFSSDRQIVYASAFVRATATGLIGVQLGIYLTVRGLSAAAVGYVVAAGLAGAALAALCVTFLADRHGRRRVLLEVGLLGVAGALAFSAGASPAVLGIAAFVGMLNGMGRDRGAALIVEQAILPATVAEQQRTRALAWYNVVQDAGHALGALLAGLPRLLGEVAGLTQLQGHRATLLLYVALLCASLLLYASLSPQVESAERNRGLRVSAVSRSVLARLSALFALDSLGGGFLTTALLSYFFFQRFGVSEASVAGLFFAARVLNAASHLGAAWLARRIGLIQTMVFTHIPSSLLLVMVAFAPSFSVAAVLFLVREALVEMDVPTRQSYVLAIVRAEERTVASGVTNLVRMAMWAVAPACAGLFMEHVSLIVPLLLGAGIKIVYDLLLYAAFRALRPPEEQASAEAVRAERNERGV